MTPAEDNIRVVHELNRMVNSGNMERAAELFTADYVDHNPGWKIQNVTEFISLIQETHRDFQLHNEILDTVASDDKVVIRLQNAGIHNKDSFGVAATGRKTSIEIIEIYRFVDGKIAERWVESDMLGFLTQIGAHFPFDEPGHESVQTKNLQVVNKMTDVVNARDYNLLDSIMADDFTDHHPGIGENISSREGYRTALQYMHQRLQMRAEVEFSFAHEDKVITRVHMHGKHIGDFMGIAPSAKDVHWTSIEIYRLENGLIVERWSEDDLAGLINQMGVRLFPQHEAAMS